jgi:hypothetical protein
MAYSSPAEQMNNRDSGHLKLLVEQQLRRQICEELLKVGTRNTRHNIETGNDETSLSVYVFTPERFWDVVRAEAWKLHDNHAARPYGFEPNSGFFGRSTV